VVVDQEFDIEHAWRRVTAAPQSLRVVAIESSMRFTWAATNRKDFVCKSMSFLKKKCKFQVDYGLDLKTAIDI
jgi:hypothetical protein